MTSSPTRAAIRPASFSLTGVSSSCIEVRSPPVVTTLESTVGPTGGSADAPGGRAGRSSGTFGLADGAGAAGVASNPGSGGNSLINDGPDGAGAAPTGAWAGAGSAVGALGSAGSSSGMGVTTPFG